ncbi:hypothetical protein [Methylobacterium sp. A54F]
MYPSSETSTVALQNGRRGADVGRARASFRPVALPALCAAVIARAPAEKAVAEARAVKRRGILELVHEDEPVL